MKNLVSFETEQSVLGTLLLDETKREYLYKIDEEYFNNDAHKQIYNAIKKLNDTGGVDTVTLAEELRKEGLETNITSLMALMDYALPHALHQHIKILETKKQKRKTFGLLQQAMQEIATGDEDITGFNSTLAAKLDNMNENKKSVSDDMKSIVRRLIEDFETKKDPKELERYRYGIKELDRMTAGLHKQEVTTIAAKSGVGKTALAIQIGKRLASKGLKTLFISREMSDLQVGKRIIASITEIDSYKLRTNDFGGNEWNQITKALNYMDKHVNMYINTECSSVLEIKNRLRQTKADVLIIDYLQLLTPDQSENNREREVAKISREIKNMSQDFNIPIIQLSQLNDESRDSRPTGERDMRESKAIYQNSNNVIFIHKPNAKELIEITEEESSLTDQVLRAMEEKNIKLVEIILAKQRDGQTGRFLQYYIADRLTFRGIEVRR